MLSQLEIFRFLNVRFEPIGAQQIMFGVSVLKSREWDARDTYIPRAIVIVSQ